MAATVAVREFASVAEMRAYYAGLNRRMFDAVPAEQKSEAPVQTMRVLNWAAPIVRERVPIIPERNEDGHSEHSAKTLLRTVALLSDFTVSELKCEGRHKPLVKARHVGYFILHHYLRLSYPKVGRLMGGRDHSSIMHGIRRVRAVIDAGLIELSTEPLETADRLLHADWSEVGQ